MTPLLYERYAAASKRSILRLGGKRGAKEAGGAENRKIGTFCGARCPRIIVAKKIYRAATGAGKLTSGQAEMATCPEWPLEAQLRQRGGRRAAIRQ